MQVTEISAQGLRREYKVVLPAADLASRLDGELAGMKDKVKINGFRPGKVPLSHLKRLYGRSLMGDVVQNAVNEANRKIVQDNNLRLATEPKIDLASDQGEVERAMEARGDLSFTVAVETIPIFDTGSFADLSLERQVAAITDGDVDAAINRLADQNRVFEPKTAEDATIETGDKATIDFIGRIEGEAFEGGTGQDVDVVVGSGSFIPGFEEQLIGARVGEERKVEVKFPDNYLSAQLAGKKSAFDVTVKSVGAPGTLSLDDDFAKGFGFDSLDLMKDSIRERMQGDLAKASRDRLKRTLLDALDKKYDFALPEGLVAQEFDNIWRQVAEEQTRSGKSFADEGTSEEASKADYRRIAERRVRLGLVLADVGEKAGVKVEDNEVGHALVELVKQYPGREQQVWDYYLKTPQALGELKAPIFEEKVVDLIVSQATVTERVVSKEDLFRITGDEDGAPRLPPVHEIAASGETPEATDETGAARPTED